LVEAVLQTSAIYDRRLDNAIAFIRSKQDSSGCWNLDYDYTDKTWVNFGARKTANKWVTLRALRVLKLAGVATFDPQQFLP